jgi:hypothetical protein
MLAAKNLDYIRGVAYRVGLRWTFYMLLQDGTYSGKDGYTHFKGLTAAARHRFWNEWTPETFADETREPMYRGVGYATEDDWLDALCSHGCTFDRWARQPHYVECWFEAAAMRQQFEHYTENVTLRPFRGDYTIEPKWRAAQDLTDVAATYPDKPIVILYFGDLDPKGLQIPVSAVRDVEHFCRRIAADRGSAPAELQFIRCGLNPGDEDRFNLPENFDRPGTFQWEALNDEAAGELITHHIGQYVSPDAFAQIEAHERAATARLRRLLGRDEATA